MVMSYMEGTPLMQLREKIEHLPQWQKDKVGGVKLWCVVLHAPALSPRPSLPLRASLELTCHQQACNRQLGKVAVCSYCG
jgi:hypothetical protein